MHVYAAELTFFPSFFLLFCSHNLCTTEEFIQFAHNLGKTGCLGTVALEPAIVPKKTTGKGGLPHGHYHCEVHARRTAS